MDDTTFRNTPLRQAMLEFFNLSSLPLSFHDIAGYLNTKNFRPNKTSIYRELDFFVAQNLVQTVDFADGIKRFESTARDHHHHAICTRCKLVLDVHVRADLQSDEALLLDQKNFKVTHHMLEFFGMCAGCQAEGGEH